MDKGKINNENIKIQELLEGYLRFRSAAKNQNSAGAHLDEDSLNAFVEGNLNLRENNFIVTHLVDCKLCVHKTAELARLQSVFESEELTFEAAPAQPAKVSEVLSALLSRLFGSSEGAVFAHEEKHNEEESESSTKKPAGDDDQPKS